MVVFADDFSAVLTALRHGSVQFGGRLEKIVVESEG
jgi:hypothetical protein